MGEFNIIEFIDCKIHCDISQEVAKKIIHYHTGEDFEMKMKLAIADECMRIFRKNGLDDKALSSCDKDRLSMIIRLAI